MTIIPAEAVLRLRSALYTQLGVAAEEIGAALRPGREQNGHWFIEPVAHFDLVRSLLDAIGWTEDDPETDIEIDLREHRPTMVTALREHLDIERDLADTNDPGQRERATTNAAVIERLLAELEER